MEKNSNQAPTGLRTFASDHRDNPALHVRGAYGDLEIAQEIAQMNMNLRLALAPLVAIADAFDANGLNEARPEWKDLVARHRAEPNKDGSTPERVILLAGRGGHPLLTLADALAARKALER